MAFQRFRGRLVLINQIIADMKLLKYWFILLSVYSYGQIPAGYYDSAEGLSGQQLRAALQEIIDDHQIQTYASLWTYFQTTDAKPGGKVWDMYSDIPGGTPAYVYTFVVDQCGNYSSEGDCYNREHSFPSSWFFDDAPMYTDLFHIYPTDGYVNGIRSSYPYGEVTDPILTSTNGSKLGYCSFTGYSGIVFEPIDDYKGDFARTYFYMMTRYMDDIESWSSAMLSGNDLAPWAKEMLVQWDAADPVSQKETDRNNAIYQIQNNRNPFIDRPEFTGSIWGFPSILSEKELIEAKVWYSDGNIQIESHSELSGKLKIINLNGILLKEFVINGYCMTIPVLLNKGIFIAFIETSQEVMAYKLLIRD
jgi:endonuclease I